MSPQGSSTTVDHSSATPSSQETSLSTAPSSISDSSIPVATFSPPPNDEKRDALVHLYFIILLFGAVFLVVLYLLIRRRNKNKLMQRQRRGRSALAEDAVGWRRTPGTGGRWTLERTEEGLDERGEAPPPYTGPLKSKDGATDSHTRYDNEDGNVPYLGQANSGQSIGPAIPLRTYQADARNHPPLYEEVDSSRSNLSLGRTRTHT